MSDENLLENSQSQDGEENLLTPDPEDGLKEMLGGSYDKFKGEDGKLDRAKLAKSYRGLETKLGSGDLAPDSPDEYGMPESLPEGITAEQLGLKEFMAEAHKVGMTKKQVDFVVGKYVDMVGKGKEAMAGQEGQAAESVKTELMEAWGADFDKNIKAAQKAFQRLADPEDMQNMAKLGNDASVMKFLAKIGKGMQEDSPVSAGGQNMPAEDLNSLMKSDAYWNPKNPDHDKVKKTVTEHFMNKNKT